MNESEQESLLLRQLAALRRRGHSHVDALALAAAGLPQGPLADRVQFAQRQLAAGEPQAGGADPLQAPTGAPDALEHAARAIDARLAAAASLSTVRLYLSIAVAGPLALVSLLAWISLPALDANPSLWLISKLVVLLKLSGIPLALVAILAMGRFTRRFAPGVDMLHRAAALLDAAATGTDPILALDQTVEVDYFCARRGVVGAPQAAVELAGELLREGDQTLVRFRHLAPLVLTVVALPLLWMVWLAVWVLPSTSLLQQIF